jgi:hypothetical protein
VFCQFQLLDYYYYIVEWVENSMDTDKLKDLIKSGATRDKLPTKSKGNKVSSTVKSAQRAYHLRLAHLLRTKLFRSRN